MAANLQSLTSELRSTKATERVKALESLKETFKRDSIVLSLDSADWLVVFNALFDAFGTEKSASLKSGHLPTGKSGVGVAAVRRLQQVAETIRWITERSVRRINRKVVGVLSLHFISHLKHRGGLFEPVALSYVKALHCIVGFTPHLEHLDRITWIKLVELSFHVVLGVSLNQHFEPTANEWVDEPSAISDSEMSASEAEVHSYDDQEETPPTPSRKRQRLKSTYAPGTARRANTPRAQEVHVVSHEQREFMALLAVLLQDPYTPILSKDNPHLPGAILHRLRLILLRYPGESSLYHDYLLSVSAALTQLSLNHQYLVHKFAVATWDGLMGMWGSKSSRSKENLVVVLRSLFPYLALQLDPVDSSPRFGYCDDLNHLWKLLGSEAERRGVEGLSLESLRLGVSPCDRTERKSAFVAKTFQPSWHFDANQALVWATLELQADCAEKLYLLSESVHATGGTEGRGKRAKVENPVSSLLSAIQLQTSCSVRAYYLQGLLFVIDRHWDALHLALRQEIINTLLQFLSFDDALVQSWTFVCFAAIAHSEVVSTAISLSPQPEISPDHTTWDTIWTHAVRRSPVPGVSRAACHAAHILLLHSITLLSPHRIHGELETLAKDLDVQGPSFPYDAVCVFLVSCMRVASRDVRLYRMQVEEKVLTWFMEAWKPGGQNRSRMPPYSVEDVLSLLTSICNIPKSAQLLNSIVLPDSPIVRMMTEERDFAVIRDFLLFARLPAYSPSKANFPTSDPGSSLWPDSVQLQAPIEDRDLVQPRGRERRVSAFLLKALEDILQEVDTSREPTSRPTAEKTRSYLDLAIIAIFFEATLLTHGTNTNRRVLQGACRVLRTITARITDRRWTPDERLLIAMAFEPLVMSEVDHGLVPPWESLLSAGLGAGIRSDLLKPESRHRQQESATRASARRYLQRAALRSIDVQDVIPGILDTLRALLSMTLGHISHTHEPNEMDVDEADGFGALPNNGTRISCYGNSASASRTLGSTVDICVSALSMLPVLQSLCGEPTRDKDLMELTLQCDGQDLLVLGPSFLRNVERRTLNFSSSHLCSLLEKVGDILGEYQWSRSEGLMAFIIHLLRSTMHIWVSKPVAEGDVGDRVRALCYWLVEVLQRQDGGARSWSCRDSLIRFFDQYLEQDPSEEVWMDFGQSEVEESPGSLLPDFGRDEDIRVRFRAAVANARTLNPASLMGSDPLERYVRIQEALSVDTDDYEAIITRLICLGNIVITSSAVRRGAYWHFLEACLHSSRYTHHIESVLSGAASRLGLSSFSQLFESYASQIAYSIRQGLQDFLRIPAHLLGYRDRRECAEKTFHAFTPTNVLASGSPNTIEHGRRLFLNHCAAIQKSPAEGLRDCFSEIVGYQIVWWIGDHGSVDGEIGNELEELLKQRVEETGEDYDTLLRQHADGVIASIVSTLSDQDFTSQGPIVAALEELGESGVSARDFRAMTRYRNIDNFLLHKPNLPAYNTAAVLQGLNWLKARVPGVDQSATTYHVLHKLFAEIDRSPLVNEQLRLLNAICLWVSLSRVDCGDPAVLRTLINGATSLLSQLDLARAAQSLLEWAFFICGEVFLQQDFRFAEILVRVGCAAHGFSCSESEEIATLGRELLQWAERQAAKLHRHKALRSSVYSALLAWPRELPTNLNALYLETTSHDLSIILKDQAISSNKFRLVRRLRDLARESQYDDLQFSRSDFWRLKECIPPSDQIAEDDLDAFCELLILQKGAVNGLGSNQSTRPTVREHHITGIKKKAQSTNSKSDHSIFPQQAIVVALLDTLHDPSIKNAFLAYRTLRSLVFSSRLDPGSSIWPSQVQGELQLLQSYPRSFRPRPARTVALILNDPSYQESFDDFPLWITSICSLLNDILSLDDPFYAPLSLTTQSDPRFSEDILPVLVHTVLQAERSTNPGELPIRDQLSLYFTQVLSSESTAVACRRSIVDVVLHLRQFTPSDTSDALAYNTWLDIHFVLLSKNAIRCGAYTTALLFLELAAEYDQKRGQDASDVEDILFDIYSHIDEPDGFYGIRTTDLKGFLVKRFHHEKQWDKAFQFHGAGMETRSNDPVDSEGVLSALHSYGFDYLAMSTLHDIAGSQQDHHMTYQLGWRTDTWDLPERSNTDDPGASLYFALRAINRERDPGVVLQVTRRVLVNVIDQFRGLGSENVTEIRQLSQSLMCLNQVKQWQIDSVQQGSQSRVIEGGIMARFPVIDDSFDFDDLETLMATRISLLRSARQKVQREQIGEMVTPFSQLLMDTEISCLLRLSQAAREAGRPQIALNSVIRAQRLPSQAKVEVSQEFANVLWVTKEPKIAVQYLRNLSDTVDATGENNFDEKIRKALLLARLGTWTSQACLERPGSISNEHFAPAAKLADEITDTSGKFTSRKADIFHSYATFAERQYHALVKSPDALRWKLYIDRKSQEIRQRHQLMTSSQKSVDTKAMFKAKQTAEALLEKDRQRFEELNSTRYFFLEQAIEMHSRALEVSDDFDDDAPIRLCSLWFANFDYDRNDFGGIISRALNRVASRKFIFLAHQLSARLSKSEGNSPNQSQQSLSTLMTRMCREHPFHSLYQVFCLKGDRPSSQSPQEPKRRSSGRHNSPQASQVERAVAAQDIFDKLRNDDRCGERVRDIETLCVASLKWAKFSVKRIVRSSNKSYTIPPDTEILAIRELRVPPITAHTPLDATCRYDNCEWIHEFETNFTTAGGINLPKICTCRGTLGGKYKQLYKGEGGDDLRQDAVMEQVFELVNIVLMHDRETRKRDLNIRNYKVIPLASQAGVIEFVVNTTPLGNWLNPAHLRYRPNDITPQVFGDTMKARRDACKPMDYSPLIPYFLDLQKRFKPVMRHFFTECHKTPMSWFSMRLNYSRSVATTSIVGHILGLGDRHLSNLLMDTSTGEIVPIDLGISFEQGTLLTVPERVPFRLTPDMIDGFGTSGTQGVFQRCAEQTLRVLRDGSEVILTVLEVFKYDPLHSWTASELKVKRAQNDTGHFTEEALRIIGIEAASGTADEAADRALSAVSRKLDKTLTVEFTVNELIAEASDVGNLALMWMGWAPFM